MSNKEHNFDKNVKHLVDHCVNTLVVKGKEYRRNNNPFHNFEVGARKKNCTREEIVDSFALKHIISIEDIVNDFANEDKLPSEAVLNEKYGDAINYLLIQYASFMDRIEVKTTGDKLPSNVYDYIPGRRVGGDSFD